MGIAFIDNHYQCFYWHIHKIHIIPKLNHLKKDNLKLVPCISRFKDGNILTSKGTSGRLVFDALQKSDIGTYYCKTTTEAGSVSSEHITLDVRGIS